ncbi:MAG: glucose-6-phosphate isomerase [Pseudomonadota bacterium]
MPSSTHNNPLWSALFKHRERLADVRVADLFDGDPQRQTHMSAAGPNGVFFDYSKNLIDDDALRALLALVEQLEITKQIEHQFAGDILNVSEQRPVLHTALRAKSASAFEQQHPNIAEDVAQTLKRVEQLVADVHTGVWRGHTGKQITDVVNIGIGGSHLGPQLVSDALRGYGTGNCRVHFLANVDDAEFARVVTPLNPAETLFIVASKSFGTKETLLNALSARAWLLSELKDDDATAQHFVAVSANVTKAVDFGIAEQNIFPMWDWVGGRFSLWSAIGLPIAMLIGMDNFRALLRGAADMDEHFASSPVAENLPIIAALVGFWNRNMCELNNYAVMPYDDRLRDLAAFLQQLEMESNGKRVDSNGEPIHHHTVPVVWGGIGTNAQHAFFQMLHQGTQTVPIDFIAVLEATANTEHHDALIANCFAQAEGLMIGRDIVGDGELANHRRTPGNKPSNMILLDTLSPQSLGSLLAMYEHKTFVLGLLWQINSFDQWGVELGKALADDIEGEIAGNATRSHDGSTQQLIERYLSKARDSKR